MESSSIEHYLIDDFTLVSGKKEKSSKRKISENEITHHVHIQNDEIKQLTLKKILKLPVPLNAREILQKLVEDDKILEIFESRKFGDGCLTYPAKINLKHSDFKHILSEDILIKILPNGVYSFNIYEYSFKSQSDKKSLKFVCKGMQYNTNHQVPKSSMEILRIENCVILFKKFPDGIKLSQLAECTKIHPLKRKKMITELIHMLHEISGDYLFWIATQNLAENIIYRNDKWIIINTCNLSAYNYMFDRNLKEFAKLIGPDFIEIFKAKFWNCKDDCLFAKKCRQLFDELL